MRLGLFSNALDGSLVAVLYIHWWPYLRYHCHHNFSNCLSPSSSLGHNMTSSLTFYSVLIVTARVLKNDKIIFQITLGVDWSFPAATIML